MDILIGRPHTLEQTLIALVGSHVNAGAPCMILVPSQSTLSTELAIFEGLGLHGSFLIDVLSPGRLQSRIFERAGRPEKPAISEQERQMALAQILAELAQEAESLSFYKRAALGSREGFAARLSQMISAFKRSGKDASEIALAAEKIQSENLRLKLRDLAKIYARYEADVSSRFADPEDCDAACAARLGPSGLAKGRHVFAYGFDIITPGFAQLLMALEQEAADVTVFSESDDNAAPDGRLFAPVNQGLDRLASMLKERGGSVHRRVMAEPLQRPQDLFALAYGLYALDAQSFLQPPENIRLIAASSVRREIHLCAAKMRQLAADGESLRAMAVAVRNTDAYFPLLTAILPQYGIAAYTAERRSAGAHPLCRFVLSALSAVSGAEFRMSDTLECLRTGFLPLSTEQSEALCAYCEQMEIRGASFGHPLRYKPSPDMPDEAFALLEDARQRAAEPLLNLGAALAEARDADDVIQAVLALLQSVDARQTLERMAHALSDADLYAEAQDCQQIWNVLMETLDALHRLLGGRPFSVESARALLVSGLSAVSLSALPPADGAVICCALDRLPATPIDTLFILGLNDDGEGPSHGLLTDEERLEAEQAGGLILGLSERESAALTQLHELKAMSAPQKRLFLSYALASENGTALREAGVLAQLHRLFPALPTEGGLAEQEESALLCAPKPSAQALGLMLSRRTAPEPDSLPAYAAAYRALEDRDEGRRTLNRVLHGTRKPPERSLTSEDARALYALQRRQTASVSRLTTYAECPFRYFVRYGLSPQETRKPGPDRALRGTLLHETVERFLKGAMQSPSWPALSKQETERLIDEASHDLMAEMRKSPRGESARGKAETQKLRKTALIAAQNLLRQAAESEFRPASLEMAFGDGHIPPLTIRLADGSLLTLKGRIDRIDVLSPDGAIRIIDYKSGTSAFDATKAYWGLQLQLLLYMEAALQAMPGSSPAGFFYCPIHDPTILSDVRVREAIEALLAKRLALNGVSLSDVRILRAQDAIQAAKIAKDGSLKKNAGGVVDAEGMRAMLDHAKQTAADLALQANSGQIDTSPYQLPGGLQQTACAHCDYASVCGFDARRRPFRFLAAKKLADFGASSKA